MTAAATGDVFAALFAAHHVGDYWMQTNSQAREKGLPGSRGRRACTSHVASMTAVKVAAVAVLYVSGRRVSPRRAAVALAVDAASHYIADRRKPVEALAGLFEAPMGKLTFYRFGVPRDGRDDNPTLGTGAAALDQSWHIAWLYAVALIACGTETP